MLAIHRLNRSRQGQRGHQTMARPCMSVIQATAPECMYPCVRVFRVNTFGFVYPFYPRFRAQWFWYRLSPPTRFNGEYRCSDSGNRTHPQSVSAPPPRLSKATFERFRRVKPTKTIRSESLPMPFLAFIQGHYRYVSGTHHACHS